MHLVSIFYFDSNVYYNQISSSSCRKMGAESFFQFGTKNLMILFTLIVYELKFKMRVLIVFTQDRGFIVAMCSYRHFF